MQFSRGLRFADQRVGGFSSGTLLSFGGNVSFGGSKVFVGVAAKKKDCDCHKDGRVEGQLLHRVCNADNHMEGQPNQTEPACPVPAKKHEHPAHYCQDTDKADPDDLRLKGLLRPEVFQVINESGGTRGNEDEAEDGDRNWPLLHGLTLICIAKHERMQSDCDDCDVETKLDSCTRAAANIGQSRRIFTLSQRIVVAEACRV